MKVTRRAICASAAGAMWSPTAKATVSGPLRVQEFSGAALVVKRQRVLARLAQGYANHEHRVQNAPETRYPIASISKTMTAGAILKLAGQGRVDLDAPVLRYVDGPQSWADIRVIQLMNHSSGLADIVRQPDFGDRVARRTSLEETVAFVATLPLDFAPGASVAYGNSGSIVAARIIERVGGMTYPEFLRTQIYEPLGMADTGFADSRAVISGLANGYVMRETGLERPDFIDMTVTLGAGSQYSTIDDLALWIASLEANRLAPANFTHRMFTPSADVYGMAWQLEDFEGHRVVDHVGDINGFGGYLMRLPREDITVAVLANLERTPVKEIANDLARQALAA